MKLYKKEGNILQIISFPMESAEKGDYLLVEDQDAAKALIAQVIDVQFAAVPGVLEELLRTLPDGGEPLQGEDIDPMEIAPHITYIQDASLLICKIRATLENEMLSPSSSWLPKGHKIKAFGCYTNKNETISVQNSDILVNPFVIIHEFYHHLRSKGADKMHRGTEKNADRFAIDFIEAYKKLASM